MKWALSIGSCIGAVAVLLVGCGSSDSTVSKTPSAASTAPPATSAAPSPAPTIAAPGAPELVDPCAVDLAAPEITEAVAALPKDPRSNQGWNPEPIAGSDLELFDNLHLTKVAGQDPVLVQVDPTYLYRSADRSLCLFSLTRGIYFEPSLCKVVAHGKTD